FSVSWPCGFDLVFRQPYSHKVALYSERPPEEVRLSSPETTTPAAANACQRELSIEIPADEVRRETETVIQKYSKLARIPGFRKGKVPAGVVRNRFAEEIKSEVVEALIPRAFRAEVEKQKLQPVSQPRVTDLKMEEGQPLHFKA